MKNRNKLEKTKIYYYLPLDGYNQPNGTVSTIRLTEKEFQVKKVNKRIKKMLLLGIEKVEKEKEKI